MKKTFKKFALHRETVLHLDAKKLEQAAGGYTPRCQYSGYGTCGTCEMTCTTNYC